MATNPVLQQMADDKKRYLRETVFDSEDQVNAFWDNKEPILETLEGSWNDRMDQAAQIYYDTEIIGSQNAGQTGEAGVIFGMAQDTAGMQGAASTLLTGTTGPEEDPLVRRRRLMAGNTATQDLLG